MYNLKKKEKTDYSGIESYVYELVTTIFTEKSLKNYKIDKEDLGWFPINKALCIS